MADYEEEEWPEEEEAFHDADAWGNEPVFTLTYKDLRRLGIKALGMLGVGALIIFFVFFYKSKKQQGASGSDLLEAGTRRTAKVGKAGGKKVKVDDEVFNDTRTDSAIDDQDAEDRQAGRGGLVAGEDGDGPRITLSCVPWNSPPARVASALALDQESGTLYLHGGMGAAEKLLGESGEVETYSQESLEWKQLAASAYEGEDDEADDCGSGYSSSEGDDDNIRRKKAKAKAKRRAASARVRHFPGARAGHTMVALNELLLAYGGVRAGRGGGDELDPKVVWRRSQRNHSVEPV